MVVLSSKLLAPLLLLADDPVPNVISQFTCCYFIFFTNPSAGANFPRRVAPL